jgi:hypothetical protein
MNGGLLKRVVAVSRVCLIVNLKESSLGVSRAELIRVCRRKRGWEKGLCGKPVSSVGGMLPPRGCATLCAPVRATVGKGDSHQTRLPRHEGVYPSWDTNGSKDKTSPSTMAQPTWERIATKPKV